MPAVDAPGQTFTGSQIVIKVARGTYPFNNLIQTEIVVSFQQQSPGSQELNGWSLRCRCRKAVIGRLDAWFANSGMAKFRPGPMVEAARTVGLSATGASCLAIASYVSKTSFDADDGHETD